MKSIKFKILLLSISLLLASILSIGIFSVLSIYNSTLFALEESMIGTIDATADMVEVQLYAYEDIANQLAIDPVLTQEVPAEGEETADGRSRTEVVEEISAHMAQIVATQGFDAVQLFDKEGNTLTIEANFANEPYFTVPRDTGMPFIADPTVNPESGQLTMPVTAPIIRDGQFEGIVLYAVNPTALSDIVSKVAVGAGSSTTIIDKTGTTIAYNDIQYVLDAYNSSEAAKTDPSEQPLADLEQRILAGEEGFDSVTWGGENYFTAFTHVDGSDNWGIYVLTPQQNFLSQMTASIIFIIIIAAAILIISAIVVIIVARKISKPISLCANRLNMVSTGDLKSPMPVITSKDETGLLASSTASIVNSISVMIEDLNYTLAEIAAGNFAVQSKAKEYYVGDFASLSVSLEVITNKLSNTMHTISDVSEQVDLGNQQVASGAQILAQGAIEQASSIEELSATITEIAEKINETAAASQDAKTANDNSREALSRSNEQMQEMVSAMNNISEKSIGISKIIKAIDDIAFQTNILSLNAAVEAARAGAAGKGFAVVADEVRNLATKSAQSAKDTATLIEETVSVVDVGNKIALSTSESINIAIESANELSALVDSIATASSTQADGALQVRAGIEQISSVVQTNSATAEESAATSEELSGHSTELKSLVSGFTLAQTQPALPQGTPPIQQPTYQQSQLPSYSGDVIF